MKKKILIAFAVMFAALLLLGAFLHTAMESLSLFDPEQGRPYEGRPIEKILSEGKITLLPDYVYSGDDLYLKLVYEIYAFREFNDQTCFLVLSARVFDRYEEDDKMNVFATVLAVYYYLYDNILIKDKMTIEPVCITFTKRPDGSYEYYHIARAKKGEDFQQSVQDFCLTPVTGKYLPNVAEQMLRHYNNYGDLLKLQRAHLKEHLQLWGQQGVVLYLPNKGKPLTVPLT